MEPEAFTSEEAARAEKAGLSSSPVRRRVDAETQVNALDPLVPRDEPEQQVAVPGRSKYGEGADRRTLQKLHIRWFPCSSERTVS